MRKLSKEDFLEISKLIAIGNLFIEQHEKLKWNGAIYKQSVKNKGNGFIRELERSLTPFIDELYKEHNENAFTAFQNGIENLVEDILKRDAEDLIKEGIHPDYR